ncbi:MAG: glycosyltransferase [Actinobacteria bacterium]|nr:glycosyltransferase [Actinomycetota bacterium]
MSNNIGARISVCLLTYNHVEVIESTLRSILDQTITGYEVIVSDDCSTDGTWERILELAAEDVRLKPVRTPHNMGMPGNSNFAVARSDRPYIALLHHDDIYRKDLLEKWAGVLDRNSDAAFVFNPYGVFESDFIYEELMPGECLDGTWLLKRYLFARLGCAVRGTAMIRREAWGQVGGMREQFGLLADVDLWMRLAMRWSVGYVSEPVITVRHQRPGYYPDIYSGSAFSWRRQRFLYEIHASNRLDYLDLNTLLGRLQWWGFRLKLSFETTKWLVYAVVRKRPEMITSSHESVTQYDLWPLHILRGVLQRTFLSRLDLPK